MLLQNLRFALRQLAKNPGFASAAVISLALGIGATTAVFSVVYAALIHPFSYRNADRILGMELRTEADALPFRPTGSEMRLLRQSPVVEDLIAMDGRNLSMTGGDYPEDVGATFITPNAFDFLGVPPLLGRGLVPSDAADGEEPQPVVVLSYEFWQAHFGRNPEVVGQDLELDHKAYRIVGVAARQFRWDRGEVYIPFQPAGNLRQRYISFLRLKRGISRTAAASVLQPILEQFARAAPRSFPPDFHVAFYGLNDWVRNNIGRTLWLLLASVGLLLAIGCGNVSILLLARGTAREHELAVRSALGAGRRHIFRQLLTESMLLAVAGGALGVALTCGALFAMKGVVPQDLLALEFSPRINAAVLGFCTAAAFLTTFLFGLLPAWQLSRTEPAKALQSGVSRIAGTLRSRMTHRFLIIAQIALTLLLLAGASAALRTFARLFHVRLGYDPHHVIALLIPVRVNPNATWNAEVSYYEQLRERVTRVSGVSEAAYATHAIPPYGGWYLPFEVQGQAEQRKRSAIVDLVDPEFFATLRIPLLQGRVWSETENHSAAPVAVINQAMARLCFPGGNAVGSSLRLSGIAALPSDVVPAPGIENSRLQIIGVVGNSLNHGLRTPVWPAIFVPWTFWMQPGAELLVRSPVSPGLLVPAIRRALAQLNPEQQAGRSALEIEQWLREDPQWQREQLVSWLLAAFAILALSLAAVGLYSVVSYTVARRTSEFGIRMALGASRIHVLRVVVASAGISVGSGLIAGVALALLLNNLAAKWMDTSLGGSTLLTVAVPVLSAVALAACLIPARRALQIDPMTALRRE